MCITLDGLQKEKKFRNHVVFFLDSPFHDEYQTKYLVQTDNLGPAAVASSPAPLAARSIVGQTNLLLRRGLDSLPARTARGSFSARRPRWSGWRSSAPCWRPQSSSAAAAHA